jgi:hypothetical protein
LHPDATENCSSRSFGTLKECIADATLDGYVAWGPDQERREKKDDFPSQ